jgi:hypothetical protein
MSLSNYLEGAFLNTLRGGGNGTSYTAPTAIYAKLHTGDPGETGTSNAATETTRKEVQFGAASGGSISLSNSPTWTSVAAEEDYTHLSLWDDDTAGNCLGSGALSATASMKAGDTFDLSDATFGLD